MELGCLALKDLTSPGRGSAADPDEKDAGQSEQKENIRADRRRSTPLKSAEPAVPASLTGRKGVPADLAHITPIKHAAHLAEPWTPTANLKVLISAASPDIRDREMRKVLFRPIENENENERERPAGAEEPPQSEAAGEEDDVGKKPSRKQKSLGLLCQKFLALYPDYPPPHSSIWISLDEVATSLGVERRRIYDIVNVLESLMIVGRIAKNSYTWHGRHRLEATLEELQRRARQQGYHLQMEPAAGARAAAAGRDDDGGEGDAGNAGGNRKDKSLRIMSQKFVMLFLVSKTQTVTLDAAAKILIEESQDSSSDSKYKTKVRRLYDIANVLTSLNLIKKVHVREDRGKKPAFKWLGPVEFGTCGNAEKDLRKMKMARHASFDITPTCVASRRQVSSAPSSPRTQPAADLPNQPVDYSKKSPGYSTAHRLQSGNGTDDRRGTPPQTPARSRLLPPANPAPPAPALHPESLFAPASSHHCLAYLPSLSQPSVVMLYRAPDQEPEGQGTPRLEPEEGRKRRREETGGEGTEVKKKGMPGLKECDQAGGEAHGAAAQPCRGGGGSSPPREQPAPLEDATAGEPPQPSHYLYVPNTAGLNSLNFLLSGGQPPAGVALPAGGPVPTLALPYVLVPSAALPPYPLVAGGLARPAPDARGPLSFSLPALVSPAHFVVGAAPRGPAAEVAGGPPLSPPSIPEQSGALGRQAGTPQSPSGPPEPMTPHTPKETTPSASKAFFRTPGTLGSVVSAVPTARKRGSAQRRLDVGHPPAI